MTLTKKDQLFLTVLLPVLIAATYVFLWIRPTLKETARLENGLKALGDEPSIVLRRSQLNTEQRRLRDRLAAAEAAATNAAPQQATAATEDPAASLHRLQETFHRNSIRLVSATVDVPRDAAQTDGLVADALHKTGVAHPKTWNVTVESSYAALLRLLDDCGTNRFSVVPVTLSMRPGPGDSKTTYWTLSVCL